ncbi:uncharacterized protein K460DRAFT_394825 [Cucurbitaria berberidis CBS 394.84]|uniref:DUF6536 domain-containing protein n=1 Tax=Cucurbitaria berberidis CBS 394.84 TaxID=1168544 RepID=A0A9P4L7J1_9PLEO|nr:uncharacterized protein K460DRAFT_394825 [Cucurbitaria berberidis CBS 394.84]KAF1845091.1 hypothetical protein K460DRAFT_394825 [Cucurbitaria berberidis CBS 394.84]
MSQNVVSVHPGGHQTTTHPQPCRKVWPAVTAWWSKLRVVVWFEATFPGWEYGVVWAIIVGMLVLCCNIVFIAIAWTKHQPRLNGLGKLLEGPCDKIDWGSKLAHGVINVLSTLLASPTRHDIDIAHKKRQWVDIGISSWRNIWQRHIGIDRIICWALLAISSAPLHLVWNSVIIFSPIAYQYNQLTVSEGFVRGLPFDKDQKVVMQFAEEGAGSQWPDNVQFLQDDIHTYENLSVTDCKKAYAQHYIRGRADVVVVVEPTVPEINSSTVFGGAFGGMGAFPYEWLCPPESRQNLECYRQLFQSNTTWIFPDYGNPKVAYCLSRKIPERCTLEYASMAAIVTIGANFFKVVCFMVTYWLLKRNNSNNAQTGNRNKHTPLITTGDALASFLEDPDPETFGMSIVEKADFQHGIWDLRWVHINPIPWRERFSCAQFRAIGLRRWLTGITILSLIPLAPALFLFIKLRWLRDELKLNTGAIKQLGIGNPSGLFLFGEWSNWDPARVVPQTRWGVMRNVIQANTPQLALSMAYYLWNSHMTVMIAAYEYDMYAATTKGADGIPLPTDRRSLYVTNPQVGTDQKATPFLVVPFKYWIANSVLWSVLHWLASQAVFFVRVDMLNHWKQVSLFSVSQVGYSIMGFLCSFAVSFIVFGFAMWIGAKKFRNRMPLAATCSGALSAACHPKDPSLKHYEKKVHWGIETEEVQYEEETDSGERRLLRCTFTSLDACYPYSDRLYA